MGTQLIQKARVARLNDLPRANGSYVLYWMQQSQRAECNHALEYAIRRANERSEPVLVCFGLTDGYPEANLRHYRFMLEGLRETAAALERRGVAFVLRRGHPAEVALELGSDASLIVCDRGYLRHQREWRQRVADEAECETVRVESDVVVPVAVASDKAEFAARTFRPKLRLAIRPYLVDLRTTPLKAAPLRPPPGWDLQDLDSVLERLDLDRSVPPVSLWKGGNRAARKHLRRFLDGSLASYVEHRSRPSTDDVSHLSPYLHFGQISPLYVTLRATAAEPVDDRKVFLDELVVRRELAVNFVYYNPEYDSYAGLPEWARATLAAHRDDPREHHYTKGELEAARTHDRYWNAAMRAMKHTGYLHNRTNTPEYAYRVTLALNNRYFTDGRDVNSYANVGWIFGLHDRPWFERPVFGKIRYMSAGGLERKGDPEGFIRKVEEREAEVCG